MIGGYNPFMYGSLKVPAAFLSDKPCRPGGRSITELLMAEAELHPLHKCLQNFPKLPLWIIEHVWAHRMTDIQEVVDPSVWPEMDSQPLSLEDSCGLRVASAQVYSIVRNRDVDHFERAIGFLEATYRLLPRLVAPIKHMKIMFGLKTMVIMWMLRQGRGMVDTVFKINRFFTSKLPHYQGHCSDHEMFLMKKNHLDFKTLALALAMDKDNLEDYITNQMDEHYGEHYAQKIEDRLLHYLYQLETVLPGDSYIDKMLKKGSHVTEEEKLLLEVITSDSTTIATTLKDLMHCGVASCSVHRVSQSKENGKNKMESPQLSKSALHGSSSKALVKSVEAKTPLQPEVFKGGEGADEDVSKDSSLLLENDNDSDVRGHQQTEENGEVVKRAEEEHSDNKMEDIGQRSRENTSPQFCSKHQRWVKSILQQCPDECSEELMLQASVSSSPLLFQSSSSITSSQDLTPSDLIPSPLDQQHSPSHTSIPLQPAAQASENANPEDKLSSESPGSVSDTSQKEPLPHPSSSRNTLLPTLPSPIVQLIDIAPIRGIYMKPHQASLNLVTASSNKQAASVSSPQALTSPHHHTSRGNARILGTVNFPLFQSSSSIISSQDINPSDVFPRPPDQQHPLSQTFTHLHTQASEQANTDDKLSSESPGSARETSQREPLPHPSSSRNTLLSTPLSPVVKLIDIVSIRGMYIKPHQQSSNHFTMSCNKKAASTSSPQVLTSPHYNTSGYKARIQERPKDSTSDQPEIMAPTNPPNTAHQVKSAPLSLDASTSTSCQPPVRQSFSRLSRKYRRACINTRPSQALDVFHQNPLAEPSRMPRTAFGTGCPLLPNDFSVSGPPTQDASTCTSKSGTLSSLCGINQIPLSTESTRQVLTQNSIKPHPQTHNNSSHQLLTLPCSTVVSSTSNSNCMASSSEISRVRRVQLRLSLPSQVVLLQSKLLQPYVNLTRLSTQECYQVTKGRSSTKYVEPVAQCNRDGKDRRKEEKEDADSSFDLNMLYSSHSSRSGGEDSLDRDPDYKPGIRKKRLLLEYENARSLIHT